MQQVKAAPVRWAVSTDPSGRGLTEAINIALATYQDMGLTKQGSAMLIANFIEESHLDPSNCDGDGGTACGIGQWRFSRQEGMPAGYQEQLKWAVEVEMIRDSGGHMLRQLLFDPNASTEIIYEGLSNWERWGIANHRYAWGVSLHEML